MNIVCLKDVGGYNLYGAEITKYLKNIFPELESAFVCFSAHGKNEALEIGNAYIKKIKTNSTERKIFDFDGDDVLLEFKNGRKVKISNSEWGYISWE